MLTFKCFDQISRNRTIYKCFFFAMVLLRSYLFLISSFTIENYDLIVCSKRRYLTGVFVTMLTTGRHKLESRMETLKVHLSDDKLRMLIDVCRHVPMPHSNSLIGLDDSIDGHIEPVLSVLVTFENFTL